MEYKIDKIDRRILYELDKNARTSDSKLAKVVKRSRESVRNRIKKLQQDGIIQGFVTSINPSKFGHMFFKMYFQLANVPEERDKFYRYVQKVPELYWFGGSDGVWDLHGTFYAKDLEEFNKLKNRVYTEFRNLIIKRDIGVLVDVRQYPKKYLVEELKEKPGPTFFAGPVEGYELDGLDKKILSVLSHDARVRLVELAKRTRSTVDIVRGRMKTMEQKAIIMQYRVAIDHRKLGYEMFKAFVYFHNLSEEDEKRLIEYAKQSPNIIYLIRQLSAWDIELEIMANNYNEFNDIMNDIRLKFAGVIRNYEFALMKEDIWVFGKRGIS
jgi:DNA-binding Lrp family transcriptional regulator